MLVRCERCNGQRTILVLGGLKKECNVCKGVGSLEMKKGAAVKAVSSVEPNHTKPFNSSPIEVEEDSLGDLAARFKRRGRPKKVV